MVICTEVPASIWAIKGDVMMNKLRMTWNNGFMMRRDLDFLYVDESKLKRTQYKSESLDSLDTAARVFGVDLVAAIAGPTWDSVGA